MFIDFAVLSDRGERPINEDCVGTASFGNKHIFVLADGLGGHGKGEVASQLVTEKITEFLTGENTETETFLEDAFLFAQKALLDEQKKCGASDEMKTTAVVLYIDGNKVSFGHIGDSRLYLIKNRKIVSRTLDHSVPQMLAISGEIKEKNIRHHEDRNRLLRAMGNEWDRERPEYRIDEKNLVVDKSNDFLLCSDGFWEWITEKQMQKVLKKKLSAENQLRKMTDIVLKNGKGKSMDNYSAILVKFKEPG
ncbi:MAG: PP2C family protein-serine/threonine phosphatase [Candidatus Fimenecus sp.]